MKSLNVKTVMISVLVAGLYTPTFAEESTLGQAVESAETAVFDLIDKESVTVGFSKNSAEVSDSEKTTLRAAVKAVMNDKKIDRVIVAAWSDSALPTDEKIKLSDGAIKLANQRAINIKKVLLDVGAKNVDVFSMAVQPNWIQKAFKTDSAQIKESLKGKGVTDNVDKLIADKLAAKGGPGKAAVIIVPEGSYLSH